MELMSDNVLIEDDDVDDSDDDEAVEKDDSPIRGMGSVEKPIVFIDLQMREWKRQNEEAS